MRYLNAIKAVPNAEEDSVLGALTASLMLHQDQWTLHLIELIILHDLIQANTTKLVWNLL